MSNVEHPGAELRREIDRRGLTVAALAEAVGRDFQHMARLIRGEHALSVDMAVRLGRALGMDPLFWGERQLAFDIARAKQRHRKELARIRPLASARRLDGGSRPAQIVPVPRSRLDVSGCDTPRHVPQRPRGALDLYPTENDRMTTQSHRSCAFERSREKLREAQRETMAVLEARRDSMPAGTDRDRLCRALDSLARGIADADAELHAAILAAPHIEEALPTPAGP